MLVGKPVAAVVVEPSEARVLLGSLSTLVGVGGGAVVVGAKTSWVGTSFVVASSVPVGIMLWGAWLVVGEGVVKTEESDVVGRGTTAIVDSSEEDGRLSVVETLSTPLVVADSTWPDVVVEADDPDVDVASVLVVASDAPEVDAASVLVVASVFPEVDGTSVEVVASETSEVDEMSGVDDASETAGVDEASTSVDVLVDPEVDVTSEVFDTSEVPAVVVALASPDVAVALEPSEVTGALPVAEDWTSDVASLDPVVGDALSSPPVVIGTIGMMLLSVDVPVELPEATVDGFSVG
jgi:hypothetical protein